MRFSTKVLLSIVAVAALIVLVWQGYLTIRYRLHNGHRAIISEHVQAAEGREFTSPDKSAADVAGYTLAVQSDALRMYVEETTGNIALYDTRSDNTVYAVHPDMKNDPNATELNRSFLQSQVSIDFFTESRTPVSWNSFDSAVVREQVKLESIDNGLRVIYTFGDLSSPTGIVPVYISEERLRMFLAPLEGTREFDRNFMRYVPSDVAEGYMEMIPGVRTAASTLATMNELFESLGYTADDFAFDMEGSGVEDAVPLHFVVPIDFTLDSDSLIVNVDTAGIREYAGGRIEKIHLLRAFGAGSVDEDGYLVVPNGSGSLIRFNNGKTYADEYVEYIYGQDPMLTDYVTLGNVEVSRFPFFGIEAGSRTILARVESGDTQAYLTAGISGKYHSYNYIYPGFILRGSLSLAMFGSTGNEAMMPVVEDNIPQLNLTVRYTLLTENGYSEMANRAREQLIEDKTLNSGNQQQEDIPFYMDLVGSTMGLKFFAGIRYMGQVPMTTYSQAKEISADLMKEYGITNQVINYQGWFNRGYYHDVANKINPVRQLGNTRELEELARSVENMGGKLYSDVNMLGAPFSTRRYNWQMESSRYYAGGMVGYWGMTNPITMYNTFSSGYPEVMHDAVSPRFLTRYMDSYIKAFSKHDLTGTSLRDMGDTLVSDRRRTDVIHREQAKEVVLHNMQNLYNMEKPIMISGGNLYALAYADDLINMPLSHNAYYVVDEEIPFYQMIVHGRLSYAGMPINLSSTFDYDSIVTRLVEYGAAPHFTFTYEEASNIKYTGLYWMYSTQYGNWSDTAAAIYKEVNSVLGKVSGAEMIHHEIKPGGMRVITYSNGVQIEVNRETNEYRIVEN